MQLKGISNPAIYPTIIAPKSQLFTCSDFKVWTATQIQFLQLIKLPKSSLVPEYPSCLGGLYTVVEGTGFIDMNSANQSWFHHSTIITK